VRRIEDYALIGDTRTAALVCRDGSMDWLCLPTFSSSAVFASLLGLAEHGRWILTPAVPVRSITRRYRDRSMVLETEFVTDTGIVRLVDGMPIGSEASTVVRVVEGVSGHVPMRMELVARLDYGAIVPAIRTRDSGVTFIGGPDAVSLWTRVPLDAAGTTITAEFSTDARSSSPFALTWHASHERAMEPAEPVRRLDATDLWWRDWCTDFRADGPWQEAVLRSAMVLKALTYSPTGAIAAAATTSLPEQIGGIRNWDYRFCWLRDSAFVLQALALCGFTNERDAWREWLLRAVGGNPAQLRVMYGLGGERRLDELELTWLPGFENSRPVRIGNAAAAQLQLDIYGEVMEVLAAGGPGGGIDADTWTLACGMLKTLETGWCEADEGLWEVRGPRRHFTHSKVMAWVAFDRGIEAAERLDLPAPVDRWREVRDRIHGEICDRGFNTALNTFTQSYGSTELDASLLLLPLVGFLPADDPRIVGTVTAIEDRLMADDLVLRYRTSEWGEIDGLPPGEGVFLACSFWLADNYVLQGRHDDAVRLFERLLSIRNDVGLLSEEFDPAAGRLLGNFPQAFSHVGLITTAHYLSRSGLGADQIQSISSSCAPPHR